MDLAIFDLDNTLLAGDSDYLWGQYLVERGIVEAASYEAANQRFYDQYKAGELDIRAFLRFSLQPLRDNDPQELEGWRADFIRDKVRPIVAPLTAELLQRHRDRGDTLLIITATNRFVTEPIAAELGIENLLATDPEIVDGVYSGEVAGIPCFQGGKVERLKMWLAAQETTFTQQWFYSDSHNDLPLLEQVDIPVAVDADPQLSQAAEHNAWRQLSLRGNQLPDDLAR